MIHRDVKPENVFLTRDERIKLLDFGVSKRIDGNVVPASDEETELRPYRELAFDANLRSTFVYAWTRRATEGTRRDGQPRGAIRAPPRGTRVGRSDRG